MVFQVVWLSIVLMGLIFVVMSVLRGTSVAVRVTQANAEILLSPSVSARKRAGMAAALIRSNVASGGKGYERGAERGRVPASSCWT